MGSVHVVFFLKRRVSVPRDVHSLHLLQRLNLSSSQIIIYYIDGTSTFTESFTKINCQHTHHIAGKNRGIISRATFAAIQFHRRYQSSL